MKELKRKNNNKNFPPKRESTKTLQEYTQNSNSTNKLIKTKNKVKTKLSKFNLSPKNKSKLNKLNINIIPINNINYGKIYKNKKNKKIPLTNNISIYKNKNTKTNKKNNLFLEYHPSEEYHYLNDYELNNLKYELALLIDKRTYLQYYWSLLRKKHLILFTFVPINDYNLFSLKLALFLLSFSLYFTINAFFFSDDTMHKIYIDNGIFKNIIVYQIPQLLYSSNISAIINTILKLLSLSERNILNIKNEKNIVIAYKKSKAAKKCIFLKFSIFFILGNILLLFFWYYISCFCVVYNNTQIILIKDTLLSFALSMIYPFGLNLLPGIFRITALRAKGKDKEVLYKISAIVALI